MFKSRTERLLVMLPWLVSNPHSELGMIAAKFGTTKKNVLEDVALLSMTGPGEYGGDLIDIFYDHDSIRVQDSQGFNDAMRFTQSEGLLVAMVLVEIVSAIPENLKKTAINLSNELLKKDLVNLIDKKENLENNDIDFLLNAISKKQAVRFRYTSASDVQARTRTVSPIRIYLESGKAYLIGLCHASFREKSYSLTKMDKLFISTANYIHTHQLSEPQQETIYPVKAKVRPELIETMKTFPNFQLINESGSVLEVSFDVYSLQYLEKFALTYREFIRIVSPSEIEQNVNDSINQFIGANAITS